MSVIELDWWTVVTWEQFKVYEVISLFFVCSVWELWWCHYSSSWQHSERGIVWMGISFLFLIFFFNSFPKTIFLHSGLIPSWSCFCGMKLLDDALSLQIQVAHPCMWFKNIVVRRTTEQSIKIFPCLNLLFLTWPSLFSALFIETHILIFYSFDTR